MSSISEVVLLDVVLKESEGLRLLSILLDSKGGNTSDSSGGTVSLVILAETAPFTEFTSGLDGNEWDLVLLSESGDELLIFGIITVLGQDAKVSILSVEGSTNLVKSFDET